MSKFFSPPPVSVDPPKAAKESKLFDQISALWDKSNPPTTESKGESIFMINRFISLSMKGFWEASTLNNIKNLPEWCYLPLMFVRLPFAERCFNKYPKNLNPKLTEVEERTLERVCAKFCCSKYHGNQVIKILTMQGINLEAS